MSRKLIIKGADFSVNGMMDINGVNVSPIFNFNLNNFTKASNSDPNYYFPSPAYQVSKLAGKTVYGAKVVPNNSGTFQIVKLVGYTGNPSGANTGEISVIGTYSGSAGKVKTIIFDEPIEVSEDGNTSFGLHPTRGTTLRFYDRVSPYLCFITSLTGSWSTTSNYGAGIELLVAE